MTYGQQTGRVNLPEGVRVAVALGVDFDAISLWDGTIHALNPAHEARGEYCVEVGAPRLLQLFDELGIRATWAIPGHTVETFTPAVRDVIEAGHEVCHHGYAHENPTVVTREREREVLLRGLESLATVGVRPRGYRSPAWDISPHTLELLEELDFDWDSSLMANDLYPYRPRSWTRPSTVQHGSHVVASGPSVATTTSKLVEVPVSWYLDDFPTQEFINGVTEGMRATAGVEARWKDTFDFAAERGDGAVYTLTLHPQTAGRPHMMKMVERVLRHVKAEGGAFMTISEIVDATSFEGPGGRT